MFNINIKKKKNNNKQNPNKTFKNDKRIINLGY